MNDTRETLVKIADFERLLRETENERDDYRDLAKFYRGWIERNHSGADMPRRDDDEME